ncbi:Receptor-like serine/threonine-protein kinase SD1-8 [Raphanus sativus]|nr:Receptor-like serine/threonine-protein kinase SD1-8 [Raphanus sativus]
MKGVVQNIYQNSYTFSFFFVVIVLLRPALSIYAANTLSSSESLTISSNRTLVSRGGVFELGFFKPSERSRWYLGIWYKKITENTYAWVANRDNPLTNSSGSLEISGNNLVLLDQYNNSVWTTNLARDTLLPEMKLGYDAKTERNMFLTSWRAQDDPTSGDFTLKLDIQGGLPEFLIRDQESIVRRSGEWDGFSGIPEMQKSYYTFYNYTENNEEVSYRFQMNNHSIYSRLIMRDGTLMQFTWEPPSWAWKRSRDFLFRDTCDDYSVCQGPNTYCDENTSPLCNCIRGYVPKNDTEWAERGPVVGSSSGCVRKTQLNCQGDHVYFLPLNNTKLPYTKTATVDRRIDGKTCEERCLSDCNCTSFAFVNDGLGCVTWTGDLVDIRTHNEGGNVLYVKVSADYDGDFSSGEKSDPTGKIIGLTIAGFSVMLILTVVFFCYWKRRRKQAKADATPIVGNQVLMNEVVLPRRTRNFPGEDELKDLELPLMEFDVVVAATQNFSDSKKVGKGGFGVVYKGRLIDGQEIAVKRLSETSAQGTDEFMTEVKLIARLQHRNLVRLLGCCVYEGEKILIYEYLENLSLDSHLFDEARSCLLNWEMRFDLINGIARGLLYLHQDSRFRIIHRDLKASNVLLDKDMTPKISDFGMARIFGQDETEATTRKVVGTYGYMSPEYAMNGTFSMKSDVFSFGVLLLEIISGKRNKGFCDSDNNLNLLGYVWKNCNDGQGLEIVDTAVMVDSSSPTFRPREILRCLQIGLLCVQDRVEDRPMMSSVVLMLGSEAEFIPQPKQPVYYVASVSSPDTRSKQRDNEACTVNQYTISIIDPR